MHFKSISVPITLVMLTAGLAAAQTPLPDSVKRVALGQAVRSHDPGKGDACSIPEALAIPAVFKSGVTEISYVLEVEPGLVRQVKASVLGDLGSTETKGTNCNAYVLCGANLCQTQFGASIARSDGQPLKKGSFTLSIEVVSIAGRASPPIELSFEVK
jgi:hypothetical protein